MADYQPPPCPKCGDPLKVGKKLCFGCGTNVSELTKPPKKTAAEPTSVVSNRDAKKVWGRVVQTPLDGSKAPGSSPGLASSPFLKADKKPAAKQDDDKPKADKKASRDKTVSVAAASPDAPQPDAPAVSDDASAADASSSPPDVESKPSDSDVSVKQALGLKKCAYCNKFCYDGEGEEYEDKLYHAQFCLAKATALLKYSNAEMELKQQPKKMSTPIDPIINEILKTEEAYIVDLGLIITHFIEPCQKEKVISEEDISTVFCNVGKLKALHEIVVVGLHAEAKKPPKIQNWGLVFKTYEASFRREYQVYTKNQSKARARRVALEEDEKFKAFLTKALAHPDIRLLDLNSYLIKPVQRICKYPLLLRELNKAYDAMGIENEEAKKDLSIAMGGMSEVLKKANDYMSTLRSAPAGGKGAAAKVDAPEPGTGNICNFCKKPVHPSERRLEDGVIYHAELCFNREKAAAQLEKKSRGRDSALHKKVDSLKVRRNPLLEQKERIAAKKAEKERLRQEKERAAKEQEEKEKARAAKDTGEKEAARLRAEAEAARVREEVMSVKAKLERVRKEQEKLEKERIELERLAAEGMKSPERQAAASEMARIAAKALPSPEREKQEKETAEGPAKKTEAVETATPEQPKVHDTEAAEENVDVSETKESKAEEVKEEPKGEQVKTEDRPKAVEEPSKAEEVKVEEPPTPEKAKVEEPPKAEEAKVEEPKPEEVKAEDPPKAVGEPSKAEEAKAEDPPKPEEVKAEDPPKVEEVSSQPTKAEAEEAPKAEETPKLEESSKPEEPHKVEDPSVAEESKGEVPSESKEELAAIPAVTALTGKHEAEKTEPAPAVEAVPQPVPDTTIVTATAVRVDDASSRPSSAPPAVPEDEANDESIKIDDGEQVTDAHDEDVPDEPKKTAAEIKAEQEREAEIILAAIDIESDLASAPAADPLDGDESVPEKGDAEETESTLVLSPEEGQFSTLRRRRAAGADETEVARLPRQVARTLRIVEEQREVFSTIRSRQIEEDAAKADALLGEGKDGNDENQSVSEIAKAMAAQERDSVADSAHALEERKMQASAGSVSNDTEPLLNEAEKISNEVDPPAPASAASAPAVEKVEDPVPAATLAPGPAAASAAEPKRRSKIASFFKKKDRSGSLMRGKSGGKLAEKATTGDLLDQMKTEADQAAARRASEEKLSAHELSSALIQSGDADPPLTQRDPEGFYVDNANAATYSFWPEPNPTDAVVRLAQTAVQVAHDTTKVVLSELKEQNLFDLPDTTDTILEDGGKFVAASLPKAMQLLSHHQNVDIELLMCFLHTYGALMLSTDLIALLRARWHMDAPVRIRDPEERSMWRKKVRRAVRNRVILVVRLWIKWHPRTFRVKSPAFDQMLVFIETDIMPKFGDQGESIRRDLVNASQGQVTPARLGDMPETILPKDDQPIASLRDVHPTEVARQLALLMYGTYQRINSNELLQRRWMMAHKTLLSPSVLNMQMLEHRVKNWFATQLLTEVDRKNRAVVMSRLILIALESIKLHNFSGAVCILDALSDPAIKRLARTWKLIPSALMTELASMTTLIDKNNDYRMLVAEMASTSVPGIPFMGAILPRIEDIEDRLPYVLNERQRNRAAMLSLSKIRLVGNLVNQVVRFQTHAFNFKPLPELAKFLESKSVDDLALLRVSLTLEPEEA